MHTGTGAGTVVSRGNMQRVMTQHQNNQFAQDVPFMGGDDYTDKGPEAVGTGIFNPGNVHAQVTHYCCLV